MDSLPSMSPTGGGGLDLTALRSSEPKPRVRHLPKKSPRCPKNHFYCYCSSILYIREAPSKFIYLLYLVEYKRMCVFIAFQLVLSLKILSQEFLPYHYSFFFFLKIYLFERAQAWEGQREKQTPRRAGSPMWGSIPGPRDHDLRQRWTLNPLSHPGAPSLFL